MANSSTPRSYKRLLFFRRTYIVDRKAQYALLTCVIMIALFFSVFSIATSFVWQVIIGNAGSLADVPLGRMIFAGLFVWLGGIIVLAVSVFATNFISNRLVGPLWRIEKHMRGVIQGETVGPLRCRETDHFQQLIKTYNELLLRMAEKHAEENSGNQDIAS
jgi:hypothetical protein